MVFMRLKESPALKKTKRQVYRSATRDIAKSTRRG